MRAFDLKGGQPCSAQELDAGLTPGGQNQPATAGQLRTVRIANLPMSLLRI
jgi:hypothetical protein